MSTFESINEIRVSEAFSLQAKVFDQLYGEDDIIHYKRQRVREHILQNLKAGDSMLELNCGSGEDALFFMNSGFAVHATDISEGMLKALKEKLQDNNTGNKLSFEQCSFTQLDQLKNKGPYDYIYSNFGGVNCTGELEKVLHSFDALLKPEGRVTLVIISRFCLWETLLLFKGKFKTAFRRFFSKKGRKAKVEGRAFTCWYYSPSFVRKQLQDRFDFLKLEGLCTIVPPSYLENFVDNYPRLFQFLKRKENKWKAKWPWNRVGDYFIISFRKKE